MRAVAGVVGAVGVEREAGKTVRCAALRGRSGIPLREEGVEGYDKRTRNAAERGRTSGSGGTEGTRKREKSRRWSLDP